MSSFDFSLIVGGAGSCSDDSRSVDKLVSLSVFEVFSLDRTRNLREYQTCEEGGAAAALLAHSLSTLFQAKQLNSFETGTSY